MSARLNLVQTVDRDASESIKLMAKQIEERNLRIRQLEKLNAQLALRIDQLEAEKCRFTSQGGASTGKGRK